MIDLLTRIKFLWDIKNFKNFQNPYVKILTRWLTLIDFKNFYVEFVKFSNIFNRKFSKFGFIYYSSKEYV